MKKSIIAFILALSSISYAETEEVNIKEEKKLEEIAADLAKPNTPYASLSFHYEQTRFDGDLENSESQKSHSLTFQPTLPFNLDNGDLFVLRPAIPFIMNAPIPEGNGNYSDLNGFGDIGVDIMYAPKMTSNILKGAGLFALFPTGTKDEFTTDNFILGPNLFYARITKENIFGVHLKQEWDVAGDGEQFSRSFAKPMITFFPGNGYNLGTAPEITYNHTTDQLEFPISFILGKTTIIKGRPWKFEMQVNHYLEASEEFDKEWRVKLTVTPVVENVLDKWF